jgi:hypothetical protein
VVLPQGDRLGTLARLEPPLLWTPSAVRSGGSQVDAAFTQQHSKSFGAAALERQDLFLLDALLPPQIHWNVVSSTKQISCYLLVNQS